MMTSPNFQLYGQVPGIVIDYDESTSSSQSTGATIMPPQSPIARFQSYATRTSIQRTHSTDISGKPYNATRMLRIALTQRIVTILHSKDAEPKSYLKPTPQLLAIKTTKYLEQCWIQEPGPHFPIHQTTCA